MAEEIIFKVGVDTGNSVSDLDKVEKQIKELDSVTKGVTQSSAELDKELFKVGAKFEDIYGELQPLSSRLGEIEDRMYELALAGKQNTKEFSVLQAEVVKYRQTIIETDRAVDMLAEQGRGLGLALQLGSGIAAGYGAVQGSMALLGVQSESLEQTLVKLQAVQAVLNSLEEIKIMLDQRSVLLAQAKAIGTSALTGIQTAYTAAVGATTGAMAALRVAMLALPIVAIIAGITALVTLFANMENEGDKVVKTFQKQGEAAEKYRQDLAKANEAQNKMTDKTLKSLDQEAARRKAMGEDAIKVQKEINDQKIKELEIAIQQDAAAVRALNAQKEKLKLSQEQAKLEIANLIREEARAAAGAANEIQRAYHLREVAKLGDQIKEIDKESNSQIQAINEQLKARTSELAAQRNAVIDLKTEQIDLNRQQGEKAAEAAKAAAEKKAEAEFEARRQAALLEVQEMQLKTKAIQNVEVDTARMTSELLAKIDEEEKRNAEIREKEHQDRMTKLREDADKAKIQIAQDSLQLIQNITELFGSKNEKNARRAFQVDKAAKISSATISGIEGTINAYKSAQGSPITSVFPAYPAIQAGLAAAFAATNIAKIAQTQFQSSGGGASAASVSAPSTGTPPVPVPEPTTTLTAGLPGANSAVGNKVFVVDSEITQQQQMSGKVQALATFGG